MTPDSDSKMKLFLKYLAPNSLNRDYTDDDSDEKSMVTESNEEGSEIEFTDRSDIVTKL